MVRSITSKDVGLKVLREAPSEAESIDSPVSIVAVHGLGAHPDDSWCKNAGTADEPKWRNWLIEDDMLPAVAPNARIMRYGYESQWFGQEAMQQSASTVAERLLRALKRARKTLLEAEQYPKEWPGVFSSTTGLVFFGTPFRGAEGMNQMEMLEAALREYHDDQMQPTALDVLQPGNAYLQDLVDGFLKKMRGQANKTRVVCFFELKSSNVGRIVGKQDRIRFVVSQHSGCLDLSESTEKRSLSRTHFDMNKFEDAKEEDFETVAEVVQGMVEASPELLWARSQYWLSAPGVSKHNINFSLRGVPVMNQFVARDAEMHALEKLLVDTPIKPTRRNVVVAHGLGGIGKTQLAVEFARKHQRHFSGIFWLDGSSEASLKQSFIDMAQRLPRGELTVDGVQMLSQASVGADAAVRECQQWLSIPTNSRWLLIIDNVDRDHHDRDDSQAYDVKAYFPDADCGSILITSRLPSLQRLGSGVKVGTVGAEQARVILESNAGRVIKDADEVLELLHGLPLALTQAGSYMRETNVSAATYAKYYDNMWSSLMKKQERFPLEEYGHRSVLTTWTISYEQVRKQSEAATWLLKLWGFLGNGEVWYELVAVDADLAREIDIPAWLREITEDELAFGDAIGLLSRYSLVDGKEGTGGHSMHSVLHRWCSHLANEEEQDELGCLAAWLVASNVPFESDAEFWKKRKRIMAHGLRDSGRAEEMYQRALTGKEKAWGPEHTSTLDTVNNLGLLYANLGRLDKAEQMYQRALAGYEKAWGPEHTSTLDTVNNLGSLYADLGRLEQAEQMYQRALAGYEKSVHLDNLLTCVPALNNKWALASLRQSQGHIEDARHWYSQALLGYEKTFGEPSDKCQALRGNLAALASEEEQGEGGKELNTSINTVLGRDQTSTYSEVGVRLPPTKPASRGNRLLRKLGWKQR
ncbi:TPR-like protein [Stemphylium lycopersici]|nr:TPR-like protein [Stemphylium lycopersici]